MLFKQNHHYLTVFVSVQSIVLHLRISILYARRYCYISMWGILFLIWTGNRVTSTTSSYEMGWSWKRRQGEMLKVMNLHHGYIMYMSYRVWISVHLHHLQSIAHHVREVLSKVTSESNIMLLDNEFCAVRICGICCQKQVSQAGISNYIPQ